jgi:CubicO group peptidase (beta-lactamase class C family)
VSIARPYLASLVLAGAWAAPSVLQAQVDSVDRFVEAYMRQRKVPGLAVAIVEGGRPVKVKGYGLANVEHRVPVTPETLFQSASVGKMFVAAGVLLLAEEEKLGLGDPVTRHLEGVPPAWSSITLRHLLSHTSGIPDYEAGQAGIDLRRDYSEAEMLQAFAKLQPIFAPGEEWSYSNTGYVLLGMIIRKVTGAHWGDYLARRIFQPLGMETARIISEADVIPNRAAGYQVVGGVLKNQDWVAPPWNTTADGSIYFSVLDLAKWDAALHKGVVLSDSSRRLAFTPVRFNDGTSASYGFGWFLGADPQPLMEHSGSWQGFKAAITRYLRDSVTVIVLANSASSETTSLSHRIAAAHNPRLAPRPRRAVAMMAEALREYEGAYRMPTGDTLRIRQADGKIAVSGIGPREVMFQPEGPDTVFMAGTESRIVFRRDPATRRVLWAGMRRSPSELVRAWKVH